MNDADRNNERYLQDLDLWKAVYLESRQQGDPHTVALKHAHEAMKQRTDDVPSPV